MIILGSRAQDDACPEKDGFFADSTQCDRYYECKNFELTEKLCPDGMVFADLPSGIERCDFPFNVDCKDRPELRKYPRILKKKKMSFHYNNAK